MQWKAAPVGRDTFSFFAVVDMGNWSAKAMETMHAFCREVGVVMPQHKGIHRHPRVSTKF